MPARGLRILPYDDDRPSLAKGGVRIVRPSTLQALLDVARAKQSVLWPGESPCEEGLALHDAEGCEVDDANYSLVSEGATLTVRRGGNTPMQSGTGGVSASRTSRDADIPELAAATPEGFGRGTTSAPVLDEAPATAEASWAGFFNGVVGWAGSAAEAAATAAGSFASEREEGTTPGTSQALAMLARRQSASRPPVSCQGPPVAGQRVFPRPLLSGTPPASLTASLSRPYHQLDHPQADRRSSDTWYPAAPTAIPAPASAPATDLQDI